MESDRELLELAAKAAGIDFGHKRSTPTTPSLYLGPSHGWWNPLTDDGDALRLAVALEIQGIGEPVWVMGMTSIGDYERDPYAATRRAIVRAAAEIEKAKP